MKFDILGLFHTLGHYESDMTQTRLFVFNNCIGLNGCSEASLMQDVQKHFQTL
jgi:hypothetical protein